MTTTTTTTPPEIGGIGHSVRRHEDARFIEGQLVLNAIGSTQASTWRGTRVRWADSKGYRSIHGWHVNPYDPNRLDPGEREQSNCTNEKRAGEPSLQLAWLQLLAAAPLDEHR